MKKRSTSDKIAFLILAAGEGKRMGKIKQLLVWDNKTFVQHIIDKAIGCCPGDVFVVLGANADTIEKQTNTYGTTIIINTDWKMGLSSSISAGVNYITNHSSSYSGILISLVDQPLISKNHYYLLISSFRKNKNSIAATNNNGNKGVPAIFGEQYFEQLKMLRGRKGAKEIIKNNAEPMNCISIEEKDYMDIDTKSDFLRLINESL